MIDSKFMKFGIDKEYNVLKEKTLIRNEHEDTFFVGASVMANMELFEKEINKTHSEPLKYITRQRIFSSNRLDDVGVYPLATSFEISLSIFRFGDHSTQNAIKFFLDFFESVMQIERNDLLYIAPNKFDIHKSLCLLDIDMNNIITWRKDIPLRLGENKSQGYYLKIFYPYKHGIIPIATIAFILENNEIHVDSSLFLERLDMVFQNQLTWYETLYFSDTVNLLKHYPEVINSRDVYMWANHLRSLIMLYSDDIGVSSKGPGHVIKKIIRELAGTLRKEMSIEIMNFITQSTLKLMVNAKYFPSINQEKFIEDILNQINISYIQIKKEIDKIKKTIDKKGIQEINFYKLKDEKGVKIQWIEKALGIDLSQFYKTENNNFWLRNECYSFDPQNTIDKPKQFLIDSENKRLKG
ncbi:hypothetical protein ABGB00_01605 [Staphylococcus saprophyticus]